MSEPTRRWPIPDRPWSRLLALIGLGCIIVLLCGGHIGSLNLFYLGLAFFMAAFVV
jgi:hypothetical protein